MLLRSTLEDLQRGFLNVEEPFEARPSGHTSDKGYGRGRITIPTEIQDLPAYWNALLRAWQRAEPAGQI